MRLSDIPLAPGGGGACDKIKPSRRVDDAAFTPLTALVAAAGSARFRPPRPARRPPSDEGMSSGYQVCGRCGDFGRASPFLVGSIRPRRIPLKNGQGAVALPATAPAAPSREATVSA